MPTVTHVFFKHQRLQNGVVIKDENQPRRANFDYDMTGNNVVITILSVLSPKRARLTREDGYTLYYQGIDDPDYRFVLECWPDNGTIKRLSVFRDDIGVEYRYISDHQDRLF